MAPLKAGVAATLAVLLLAAVVQGAREIPADDRETSPLPFRRSLLVVPQGGVELRKFEAENGIQETKEDIDEGNDAEYGDVVDEDEDEADADALEDEEEDIY
mmetsp:Transcript_1006/g.1771  ORF Transcript_1006/g.1771 Transcript_1006/m.1771 type:complete len:102 (-) Transcript_1006:434-739(-)|eukprot:CAMPEP_0177768438 /NCGR_PEP_ID=MMETSP0491_2-20121128/9721_1 /TAXON_ID=63592 /ORGANISM="Tetraselmis chuii, Strain PLY429" /LENGTH=101 /DNA_ID=CAMNT_0019285245 /DNA_START=134 /DNA_END=439 /DNA_ORIENTATION=+